MKSISIKLPEALLDRLRKEAEEKGESLSSLIRLRLHDSPEDGETVHDLAGDLAGSVEGSRLAATNDRPRFSRK